MLKTTNNSLACDGPHHSINTIGTNRFPRVGLILVQLQMKSRSHGRPSHASLFTTTNHSFTHIMKKSFLLLTVTLLATLASLTAATHVSAAIVTFNFSGTVTYMNNLSNAIPADIHYGSPMTGSLTYDTAATVYDMDFNSSPDQGDFYFNTTGIFSFSVKIGIHTFANVPHTTEFPYADFVILNDYFGEDALEAQDGSPYVFMDGGAFPGNADAGYIYLELVDNSALAFNSDALPLSAPTLAQVPDIHEIEVYGSKYGNFLFDITATITNLTGTSLPVLKIQPQLNKTVMLSWPLSAQGFGLEQNTNLIAGVGWKTNATPVVDTATEHTVTVPTSSSACFFRLKSP
jgi:hypothetical protein